MAQYRFRLDPVRRVRQARRDELRMQLADAYRAAETLVDERRRIGAEADDVRSLLAQVAAAAQMDVGRMLDLQRYELVLKAADQDVQKKLTMVEEEVDRRRQAVLAAEREVKVLDSLDGKGRERHRIEEERRDVKRLDEVAGTQWARKAVAGRRSSPLGGSHGGGGLSDAHANRVDRLRLDRDGPVAGDGARLPVADRPPE